MNDATKIAAPPDDLPTVEFLDPHFHIWGPDTHDMTVVFAPGGEDPLYTPERYEAEFSSLPALFVLKGEGDSELKFRLDHRGGVFVEAMSVCFNDLDAAALNPKCLAEASWASEGLLSAKSGKAYVIVGSLCLEDPGIEAHMAALASIPGIRGIRQIVNKDPSWPRNGGRPDFLGDDAFWRGYDLLSKHGLSFDLQLNPGQFAAAAAKLSEPARLEAKTPVIVNHLGCMRKEDLDEASGAAAKTWEGLAALAAVGPHVFLKISMLCYTDAEWEASGDHFVGAAVHKAIAIFGVDRCIFASNFPVDVKDGWAAPRLLPEMAKLAAPYGMDGVRALFGGNTRRAYRF